MADNNRNQMNRSYSYQDRNDENWRRDDVNFRHMRNQRDVKNNQEDYGQYGNYQDYENRPYGNTGNYGNQRMNRYNDWENNDRRSYYGNASYVSQNENERYWKRNRGEEDLQDRRNERQDWGRSRVNTGNYYDRDRGNYSNSNYGRNWEYSGRQGSEHTPGQNRWTGNEHMNYGNSGHGREERDWWDRTRDEVSSWFGDEDAQRRRKMDQQNAGQHKGKGPRGYTRSDDRIREDVCDRLSDDDFLDASDIDVQVKNSEVILHGKVDSRSDKHRAEDLVESISGVRNVENHLKVSHSEGGATRR